MTSKPTASINIINPNFASGEGYELSDQSIIPNADITATFTPFQDIVELWAYDVDNNLIGGIDNFLNYTLIDSPTSGEPNGNTSELSVNPENDIVELGFDQGTINVVYNFIQYKLASNAETKYYISEISSDRTELRLSSNFIDDNQIRDSYSAFKSELDANIYFDEFYLNFGDNEYQICVNVSLDISTPKPTILIKLYDALPPEFSEKDEVCVVVKPAESLAYNISFPEIPEIEDFTYIKGPNYTLKVNEFTNNSTELKSQSDLLKTDSSGSLDNLQNILNRKGVTLTPNYSYDTFNEFVNFSSAKTRIENFVEKVTQIQSYQSDIESLNVIVGPTSQSFTVSSSIATAYANIETLVKNFDGYEYFLYYGTGSSSYPKTGSSYPYELLTPTNPIVSVWLGSDQEINSNYGGIILSASIFDFNNQNWLYYTIPEFIRDNGDNNQYLEFSNMVGQHFDEVWLYTRAVTEKLNTTPQLDNGVPLDLADDVITSLGYTGFGNNFNNQDNFIGLTGENNGVYVPPTGSELITNYIAVNNGTIINYWNPNYSWENYVESLDDPGFPYAIDKVSKEIYKRLYHNMNYLVKKKGTVAGLRQLINIWGIPNTILRINEFGGKDKDNSDDYDLWYNRYSYAYTPISTQNVASSSVVFPWMPLERNRIADSGRYIVPDNFQFRFKTTGYPSSSFAGEFFTQSLAVKKSDGDDTSTDFDFGVSLFYEPIATGSYSGSASSEYENWGKMRFHISGAAADGGVATSNDIYLPFFDKGWWTVMLQRNQHVQTSNNTTATTYTLYAKNKINNGWDGAQIGFEGSASIVSNVSSSINEAWNKFGTTSADGIYLGGFVSGSSIGGITTGLPGKIFSGSLQEFRYYSNDIPEATFNDFVMNPESIEGNSITGSQSSFDIVNFRAPLGNELESIFTSSVSASSIEVLTSMHPAITGSAEIVITGSFVNPSGNVVSSTYNVIYYENNTTKTYSKTNTEVYFLDQPAIGFRNRISDKIQIRDGDDFGNILSNRISIQQDAQISRSYTENINSLEVAFSPQDEVNDDIIASFGYGVIADTIADPRFISSSDDYYPQLRKVAEDYFQKYTEGSVYDYIRLIKYFDNSIFKAIKSYVPARTSVSTGIVIKQHMLERNRFQPVQISEGTIVAVTPSGALNTPIIMENIVISGSIDAINQEAPSGSTGGSANKFNYVDSSFLVESGGDINTPNKTPFGKVVNTQSYEIVNETTLGAVVETINNQHEFYDGEFSGSELIVTTQSLFNNPFLNPSTTPIEYYTDVYNLETTSSQYFDLVGPTYAFPTFGSSPPKGTFPQGYAFFASSSLIVTTASLNETLPLVNKVTDKENILSLFNDISVANYSPTPFISASLMSPNHKPLVVGLIKISQGDQLYLDVPGSFVLPAGFPYEWADFQQFPLANMRTPATRSFFPSYVGFPSTGSANIGASSMLSSNVSISPYINSSTVSGVGTTALQNPQLQNVSWPYDFQPQNLATPGFRLDLTSVFPMTGSYSEKVDMFYGGEDYRIVDSITFLQRSAKAIYQNFMFSSLGINWGEYTFLYHGDSVEELQNTRPIQQFGELPTLDQIQISGSGGGATRIFATVTGPNANPQIFNICSTNKFISEEIDMSSNTPQGPLTGNGEIAVGMDVYAINDDENTITALEAGVYVYNTGNGIWTQFEIAISPSAPYNEPYYIFNFSAEYNAGGGTQQFPPWPVPYPNNNFPPIIASWDTQEVIEPGSNFFDVMPIDGQSYSGGVPALGSKSSNQYLLYNFYAAQQRGLESIQLNQPIIGTASLYTYPVSFTSSLPLIPSPLADTDYYYSGSLSTIITAFSVNDKSINVSDPTDDIDNSLAFDENPNIRFSLDFTGSLPASTSPPGNIFDLDRMVSSSRPNISSDIRTYLFLPTSYQNQSQLAASPPSGDGFNLSSTPTFYSINPYIANTGIGFFENTVYYATPNNFNENRPNKFKFVIENQFGINTTSNLTAISNFSATKVQTPESNYTQLASIIPKYSGSKITSANYNFYSAPTTLNQSTITIGTGSFEIVGTFNATGSSLSGLNGIVPSTSGKGNQSQFTFNLATNQSINSIIVTNGGFGYVEGDTISFSSQSLGSTKPNGQDLKLLLKSQNITITNPTQFADGTTGVWGGDDSYGKIATIDKNPIYFAHFKSSKNNLELDGTYTFTIDQLIESPLNDITNNSLSISPKTIEINGSNDNLINIANTFEKGRKTSIAYQAPLQIFPISSISYKQIPTDSAPSVATFSAVTNYQLVTTKNSEIFQSGLEYETIITTQPNNINFLTSASMNIGQNISILPLINSGSINGKETISYLGTASGGGDIKYGKNYWAFASGTSDIGGYIDLKGGPVSMSVNLAPNKYATGSYFGDFLAVAHSYNYWVENQLLSTFTLPPETSTSNLEIPGLPTSSNSTRGIPVPNTNPLNFNSFNFSSSEAGASVLGYSDYNLPFLIKRGDEIRVTYDVNFTGSSFEDITRDVLRDANYRTQDFTVTNIGSSDYANDNLPSIFFTYNPTPTTTATSSISDLRVFDRLFVTPNPIELDELIPSGSIYQFTVRRRNNADDSIIIYQTPPINTLGSQTPTGDGFLIPNDFTQIQKRNVQTLVNQLKNQNAVNPSSTAQQSLTQGPSTS